MGRVGRETPPAQLHRERQLRRGVFDAEFANGGTSTAFESPAAVQDDRVEHCLTYKNSDDGIDTWRSTGSYMGYSISHQNGIADGERPGRQGGRGEPPADSVVERCLSYSRQQASTATPAEPQQHDLGQRAGLRPRVPTPVVNGCPAGETAKNSGTGVPSNNSWQRSGSVAFISTNPELRELRRWLRRHRRLGEVANRGRRRSCGSRAAKAKADGWRAALRERIEQVTLEHKLGEWQCKLLLASLMLIGCSSTTTREAVGAARAAARGRAA